MVNYHQLTLTTTSNRKPTTEGPARSSLLPSVPLPRLVPEHGAMVSSEALHSGHATRRHVLLSGGTEEELKRPKNGV